MTRGNRTGTAPGKPAGEMGAKYREGPDGFPVPGEAMIREVHVYGKVAALHRTGEGTQHLGLGRALVEEACRQAAEAGFAAVNVISAVGTRAYYRRLGFKDAGLYQRRPL